MVLDGVVGEQRLPCVERLLRHERREPGDRARLPRDERVLASEPRGREERRPVEARRLPGEVGARPVVVPLRRVLAVLDLPVRLRDARLEREDRAGAGVRVADAREGQHAGRVRAVGVAQRRHLRRRVEVVAAVGELEAALHQRGRVARRAVEILRDPEAERVARVKRAEVDRIDVGAEVRADEARERAPVADRGDAVEQRADGRRATGGDRRRVEESGVEIADPAQVGPGRRVRSRGLVDDDRELGIRALGRDVERAVAASVGRDPRPAFPVPVGVPVEIVAGPDGRVHAGGVETGDDALRAERGAGGQRGHARERDGGHGTTVHARDRDGVGGRGTVPGKVGGGARPWPPGLTLTGCSPNPNPPSVHRSLVRVRVVAR